MASDSKFNIQVPLRIALIAFLILFPTILILLVNGWAQSKKMQTSAYRFEVTDKDGRHFSESFSQGAWPDTPDYRSMSFGKKLLYVIDTAQPELHYDILSFPSVPHLTVKMTRETDESVWSIQFGTGETDSETVYVRRVGENLVRILSGPPVTALMSDRCAACLYPYSEPPRLNMQSSVIVPSSAFWKFRAFNGALLDGFQTQTISVETYQYSGTFRIAFDRKPTLYTVSVTGSFGTQELQTLEDLCTLINSTESQSEPFYEIQIHAEWDTEEELQAYGWLNYRFHVVNASETRFFLNVEDGIAEGGIGILTCKKIAQPEKLVCLAPEGYPHELSVLQNGSDVIILIPFPDDAGTPSYTFRITYDIFEAEFTIPVRSLDKTRKSHTVKVPEEVLDSVLSDYAQSELSSLQRTMADSGQQTPLFCPDFQAPKDGQVTIHYGDTVDYGPGESSFNSPGTFYAMPMYTEVTCLNSGVVLKTGHSDYLGYYVIVDHGAVLKTWYTGLSSPCISENEAVRAGDVIGYSGNTSFLRMTGTYVYGTLRSAYVSVEELIRTGLHYKEEAAG